MGEPTSWPETPAPSGAGPAARNDLAGKGVGLRLGRTVTDHRPWAGAGVFLVHTWAEVVLEMNRGNRAWLISHRPRRGRHMSPSRTHQTPAFGAAGSCLGLQVTFRGPRSMEQGSPRLDALATAGPDPVCPEARSASRQPQPSDERDLCAHIPC